MTLLDDSLGSVAHPQETSFLPGDYQRADSDFKRENKPKRHTCRESALSEKSPCPFAFVKEAVGVLH